MEFRFKKNGDYCRSVHSVMALVALRIALATYSKSVTDVDHSNYWNDGKQDQVRQPAC